MKPKLWSSKRSRKTPSTAPIWTVLAGFISRKTSSVHRRSLFARPSSANATTPPFIRISAISTPRLAVVNWPPPNGKSLWQNGAALCPPTSKPIKSPNSKRSSRNRNIAWLKNPPPATRNRNPPHARSPYPRVRKNQSPPGYPRKTVRRLSRIAHHLSDHFLARRIAHAHFTPPGNFTPHRRKPAALRGASAEKPCLSRRGYSSPRVENPHWRGN